MGLFEIFFERRNPGAVGNIEKNNKSLKPVKLSILMIKLLISGAIIWFAYDKTIRGNLSVSNILIFIGVLSFYCFISYNFIPKPATSNMGWLGGMVDNPLRYSDDLNRMLVGLFVLLLPGRFVSTTVMQSIDFWFGINGQNMN